MYRITIVVAWYYGIGPVSPLESVSRENWSAIISENPHRPDYTFDSALPYKDSGE